MPTNPRQLNQALVDFLYQSPIGLIQTGLDGSITRMNPMAAQMLLPLARHGCVTNLFDILRLSAPQLPQLVEDFAGGRGMICESLRIASSASTRNGVPPRVLALNLFKLDDAGLLANITDVTREIARGDESPCLSLQQAARVDVLTALPNRAAALDRIRALIADIPPGGSSRFAVLFLDCDHFSQINDSHGRALGDALLRGLASRLAHAVRAGDVVSPVNASDWSAARLGGDEFLVVLDGIDTFQSAMAITQRLLDSLSRPHEVDGQRFRITLTAGLVPPGQISGDAEALLHDAYLAMTQGKRSGGDRVAAFEPAMRIRAHHRGRVEHELYQAISNSQLFVNYLPQVRLADRQLIGFEALVRWAHPLRGTVLPPEFIEIAEESRLIHALGEFVLTRACRQALRWASMPGCGAPGSLSVNLSREQLMEPGLVAGIESLLVREGFDPHRLVVDVTESVLARNDGIQRRLRDLKDLGVRLALDDFGSGWSSLSELQRLPVDVIKIDRALVREIGHSTRHRVLVEAMLRVAQSLDLRTVAVGIETEAQLAILRELNCDEGQGYLFSPPLDAAASCAWVQAQAAPAIVPADAAGVISLPSLAPLG